LVRVALPAKGPGRDRWLSRSGARRNQARTSYLGLIQGLT
jgi:hypothetical protein